MEFTPKINNKELQDKVNEYTQKAAIEVVKDFYSGYNSPYKKAIEEKAPSSVGVMQPIIYK